MADGSGAGAVDPGALLSLQREPEEMAHRDELMFQTVHQSTELWLKHACFEVEEAARQVAAATVTVRRGPSAGRPRLGSIRW